MFEFYMSFTFKCCGAVENSALIKYKDSYLKDKAAGYLECEEWYKVTMDSSQSAKYLAERICKTLPLLWQLLQENGTKPVSQNNLIEFLLYNI